MKKPHAKGICAPSTQPEPVPGTPREHILRGCMQHSILYLLKQVSPVAFHVLIHDAESMQGFLKTHEKRIKELTRKRLEAYK